MKLTEIVPKGAVVAPLESQDRDGAINELISALIASGACDESMREPIRGRVLERERKLSTGFGRGVAVPHAKHPATQQVSAAIGVSQRGIDFASPDKQPVYIVVLLLSPEERPEDHLRAMEAVFKHLSKDSFRRLLRQAQSPAEVWEVLVSADGQSLV
jgi:PTS system fructose-specific IIA component/PTS system nitrogen regulatory IIA component